MAYRHLLGAVALASTAASLSAQSVKTGIDAWQRADYAAAITVWRPLAEKGDADAEFNLGQAYRLGRGAATNLAAAKTWFERAARQGHTDAQTTLGLLLFQNGDQAGGLKWLKQAAEKGEPRAQLVYGTALVNGDGVTQNPGLGYAFVSRAAASGLKPAKDTLEQLSRLVAPADRKRGARTAARIAKTPVATTASPAAAPPKLAKNSAPAAAPAQPTATAIVAATTAKPMPAKAPPANGGWRIQLGAFSQRSSAQALYQKLSGKPLLAGRSAFYIPVAAVTRLQVGPFESKAAADAACRSAGVPCFPVPAK